MREPDFQTDGWSLEDGEAYHSAAPDTFWIPELERREGLEPGDFAKLIFYMQVGDDDDDVAVERMWVIVRERIAGGYLGILDNEPDALTENDTFWVGTELPFAAKHVINIIEKDAKSIALAQQEPLTRWPTA